MKNFEAIPMDERLLGRKSFTYRILSEGVAAVWLNESLSPAAALAVLDRIMGCGTLFSLGYPRAYRLEYTK